MENFDVTIIGSGPGGYVGAIRCAQLGLKTALIEKYDSLGGTCLNVGCIPSKALLDSSEHFHNAEKNFEDHGISLDNLKVDLPKMIERKNNVVETTTKGIDFLMDKNKVTVFHGTGSIKDKTHVVVETAKGEVELETKNIIIATGSKPANLPFITIDKERVITSTEALNLQEVPKHLIVIGGGVIGLELGSVYKRLGADVTVVEYMDKIVPGMDGAVSKELLKVMKKQKMKFNLSSKVTKVERKGEEVEVTFENKKGETETISGDYCLVAIGRKPYTEGLGLDNAGIELDQRGRIMVDDHLKTNVDNIYAIGDVIRGAMLAHKAEEEGILVAEQLAGQKPHIDYNLIPGVVYTWPEAAGVGKTEEQLKEEGIQYKAGQFSVRALGRARASGDIDGMVKVLADAKTDEVLGVHMVSARAADMIAEAVLGRKLETTGHEVLKAVHPHPTMSEAVMEAVADAYGEVIHL